MGDVICSGCGAGFRRVELTSRMGDPGEYRCSICSSLIEALDGSKEVAYRLTVFPTKGAGRKWRPAEEPSV